MAAGGVAAIAAALGAVGNMVANQGRASGSAGPVSPRGDTTTAALALAHDKKHLKALQRNAQAERLLSVLTDPHIMGAAVTLGGLYLSTRIRFHEADQTNANLQGVSAAAMVAMGLGRAGVGDLTSSALAATAAAALIGAQAVQAGGGAFPDLTLREPITGFPLVSAYGPIPALQWTYEQVKDLKL